MSTDEAIRDFNMMMNEKVKKDLLERKSKGGKAGSSGGFTGGTGIGG